MKKNYLIVVSLLCSLVLAQSDTAPKKTAPKVVETPIHIIELDNTKLPTSAQPKTIFQCTKGKTRVYVDKMQPGLTDCQQINQRELTKFQPSAKDNAPQVQPAQPTHIQPDTTVRPNLQGQPVQSAQQQPKQPATNGQYQPPCSGMITYKGRNYIMPTNQPCPIPDAVFQQLVPVAN